MNTKNIKPVRGLAFTMVSALRRIIPYDIKAHIKNFLLHATEYVTARPKLRNTVLVILDCLPSVKSLLINIIKNDEKSQAAVALMPIDLAHLTPRARQIYDDLKIAIECCQKENR